MKTFGSGEDPEEKSTTPDDSSASAPAQGVTCAKGHQFAWTEAKALDPLKTLSRRTISARVS